METTITKWDESMAIRCFSKYPNSKKRNVKETAKPVATTVIPNVITDKKEIKDKKSGNEPATKPDSRSYPVDSDIKQWENFRRALTY